MDCANLALKVIKLKMVYVLFLLAIITVLNMATSILITNGIKITLMDAKKYVKPVKVVIILIKITSADYYQLIA